MRIGLQMEGLTDRKKDRDTDGLTDRQMNVPSDEQRDMDAYRHR